MCLVKLKFRASIQLILCTAKLHRYCTQMLWILISAHHGSKIAEEVTVVNLSYHMEWSVAVVNLGMVYDLWMILHDQLCTTVKFSE